MSVDDTAGPRPDELVWRVLHMVGLRPRRGGIAR